MKFSTNSEVSAFAPEQQDALLAEMQQGLLNDYQAAASVADRAHATTAFADASRARNDLSDIIATRRRAAIDTALRTREAERPTGNITPISGQFPFET